MRAALVTAIPAEHLEIAEVPDPQLRPGELLLEVSACGICGTDLHILEGRAYRPDLPFVMGHEAVGAVVEACSPEDAVWIGRRVTMSNFVGDGTCRLCHSGDERLCRHLVSITGVMQAWGGFAERMVVRREQVIDVPAALPDEAVAALVDAGASAANSVRVADLRAGSLVVVVGGGPLGFLAAESAQAAGCDVIVVQPSEARRAMIAGMGFSVRASIAEVDDEPAVVIDAAGAPDILPWALRTLAPQGTYVAAAYGPVDGLDLTSASRKELVIRGIRSGRRDDLRRIMRQVVDGDVRLPPLDHWPLDRISDAIGALRAKTVPGKAIIDVAA